MSRFLENFARRILYAGLSREEYELIQGDLQEENRKSLMTFSAITVLFLLIMFLLSFVNEDVEANRFVYLTVMAAAAVIFVLSYISKQEKHLLILVIIYAFVIVLFVFGIVLGTVTRPDEQTVSFVALLLTVPLLFTDRPVRMILCILLGIACFIKAAVLLKADYVLAADIIDVTVFGTISAIVSTYMMSLKCERFLYERKVSVLSQTDLLTGLCNRNSYEQRLKEYASAGSMAVACIYVDVNGLHEMNNTMGHAAGDRMLKFVGSVLQKEFGENNSFRIGGDEFVVLAPYEEVESIDEKTDRIKVLSEEKSYHVSIGYSAGNTSETDISVLINTAEKRMYDAKRMFYQQKGTDRRER